MHGAPAGSRFTYTLAEASKMLKAFECKAMVSRNLTTISLSQRCQRNFIAASFCQTHLSGNVRRISELVAKVLPGIPDILGPLL